MKNKNSVKKENPEIAREREEKRKADLMYGDDGYEMRLFPEDFMASAASATESTGLIQSTPPLAFMTVFDDLYSYRQTEPEKSSEEDK